MRGVVVGGALVAVAACGSQPAPAPPPAPARVYAMSEVDERPEIVLTPPLRYPDDPRLAGVEGVVVVRVVVDTAGNPEPATALVVQQPDSALGAVGRAMVLRTLFRPARVRGHVVRVMADVPVDFASASLPPVSLHVAGDVYSLEDVQERPHLTSSPPLTYPAPLLLAGIEGRVLIQAIVDTTGNVELPSLSVVESSDPRFNAAAKDYVLRAHFAPGRMLGHVVRVRFQIPVDFRLPSRR